jgi:hypothetical protein
MSTDPTSGRIRRFINSLDYGVVFYTRDCLNFGSRGAVDQCLFGLVREEYIVRVARGAFMRRKHDTPLPSVQSLAIGKAKAFGRRIYLHARKALLLVLPGVEPCILDDLSYAIDGATSSFDSIVGRINFFSYAPRKLTLEDTIPGLVIRGLWALGKEHCTDDIVRAVVEQLGRREKQILRNSCHIMPAWLAEQLVWNLLAARTVP